jgi:hypothetical protein
VGEMPKKVSFRLTAVAIKKRSKPGLIADGGNLYLQVSESGSKSWVFRYRLGGRNRAHGLGAVDVLSLDGARAEALRCRQLLREGLDPIEERRARLGLQSRPRWPREHSRVRRAVHRRQRGRLEEREARGAVAHDAGHLRVPTLGAIPSPTCRPRTSCRARADLEEEARDRVALRGRIEQVLDFAKARELRGGEIRRDGRAP